MILRTWQSKSLGFLLVLLLILGSCKNSPASLQEHFTQLESEGYSGAILVSKNGQLLHEKGYGYASCDQTIENTADTIFSIGSITKDFTAAAIAQLDAAGLLQAEDSITQYLEAVPEDKAPITIGQLLDHRSGLGTYHETKNLGDFEMQTRDQAVSEIFNNPLLFRPGSGREYSNSGYTLLAAIIEEVTGQSYTDYITQKLLIPSGMNLTGFWGDTLEPMASTKNKVLGCSEPSEWQYSWVLVGNGGMLSTVGDLQRWIAALQGEKLLDESTKQKFGYQGRFEGEFGSAGGSSQHEFNAAIEFTNNPETLVVAISNTNKLRAESVAISVLRTAITSSKP